MKVLFVLPYLPSPIRVRPYQLLRQLAKRHEIVVLATDRCGTGTRLADLQTWCQRIDVVPSRWPAAVRSCTAAVWQGDPLQAAVCQSPELERRLGAMLADDHFDLVHVEHLRAARLAKRVPQWLPTFFDAVDCISLLLERTLRSSHSPRQRLMALIELRRTRAYEARLLRRFDRVAVTSPVDARALQALEPSTDVAVVPNGVDMDRFQPQAGPREPATLVFWGKLSYHANVTAVLHFAHDIFPRIRARRRDVRLQIVGSNPPQAVRALARDPAVSITGYVEDLGAVVGRATLAVCPMTVKAGIQNKVLEALALGLPVVATSAAVEGLAARPGRDLLVADTPAEYAESVCRLLADVSLRSSVARAGRQFVATHHQWATAADRIEALYAETRDRRARSLAVFPLDSASHRAGWTDCSLPHCATPDRRRS